MATSHQIGSRDKSVGWYTPTLSTITSTQRDLLENYSKIAPESVIPHILKIRDQAWEIHPYPCIGQLRFIDLSLHLTPSYPLILKALQQGAKFLDLGCCFAQDLRKLIHDGAPSSNLYGAELMPEFLTLGYELFGDKETFQGKFMQADIFDEEGALKDLVGQMDMIQIGLFLHLFDYETQVKACKRIISLVRKQKGSLIIGQQIGLIEAGESPTGGGRVIFKHNVESFEKMWKEAGEQTGSEWVVRAKLDAGLGIEEKKRGWDDPSSRRLVFEVERVV